MKKLATALLALDDFILKLNLTICGALLLGMVAIEGMGVIFRFILHDSLSWSDELSAYMFVWLTCLGAAAGIKLRVHPEVKALADRLPLVTHKTLADLADIAIIALGAVFLHYGGDMLELMGTETASSLPISMVYPYLSIPVGGALLIFHAIVRILVSHLAPQLAQIPIGSPALSEHI